MKRYIKRDKTGKNSMKKEIHIQDTGQQKKKMLGRLIDRISLFVLAAFLVFFCVNGLTDWQQADFLFETHSEPVIALLVICATVSLWQFYKAAGLFLRRRGEKGLRLIAISMLVMAGALQLLFLFHYRNLYLFDNAFVTGGASTLATGDGVAPQAQYYFSVYPNQNAYIVLSALLWKTGSFLGLSRGQMPYLLNAVNLLCLDGAFFLTYQTFVTYKKDASPADRVLFLLLLCMNPFLYIGVCYYYTIVLSMPFVMALIYLYIRYYASEGKVLPGVILLTGLCFGVGYLLRATTIIPMIAVFFCCLYFKRHRKEIIAALVAAVCCMFLLGRANTVYIGLDTTDTAFPTLHWVMMSLTEPGTHNEADEAYTASFATKEEKQAAVKLRIREKLSEMSSGDLGRLLISKLRTTFGSGSNGYTVYLENCVETDGFYEWVFGRHKDACLLYHQVYYLLLLVLFLRQIMTSFRCVDDRAFVWQLTYLGVILFYLLWESSGQYSLPFLPLLLLGAGVGQTGKPIKRTGTQTGQINLPAGQTDAHTEIQTGMPAKQTGIQSRQTEKKEKKHRKTQRLFPVAAGLGSIAILLFLFVRKYPVFTQQIYEWNHPVVTQILANDESIIAGETQFCQEFETDQPFNRIIFQYTNPNENTQAVYEVRLVDEAGNTLFSETISLCDALKRSAAIYDFATVRSLEKETYRLCIRMREGSATDRLGIISYSMGHYDALPGGACYLGEQEMETDMLLAVSEVSSGPYMSKGAYLLAGIVTGIILFLPILGILVYTRDTGV